MTKIQVLTETLPKAVEISAQITSWLEKPNGTSPKQISNALGKFKMLIEGLSPLMVDLGQMVYFRNRLASTRALVETEPGAALYQMREIHKKLSALMD